MDDKQGDALTLTNLMNEKNCIPCEILEWFTLIFCLECCYLLQQGHFEVQMKEKQQEEILNILQMSL